MNREPHSKGILESLLNPFQFIYCYYYLGMEKSYKMTKKAIISRKKEFTRKKTQRDREREREKRAKLTSLAHVPNCCVLRIYGHMTSDVCHLYVHQLTTMNWFRWSLVQLIQDYILSCLKANHKHTHAKEKKCHSDKSDINRVGGFQIEYIDPSRRYSERK